MHRVTINALVGRHQRSPLAGLINVPIEYVKLDRLHRHDAPKQRVLKLV